MSEYQYYEFLAVDHPLTKRQMSELHAISTRADITPTSFVNVYHWGDLKADPANLLARYFDVHVYVANWGTRRLMLRLPTALVDGATLRPYEVRYHASTKTTGAYRILDLYSDDDEEEEWDDGSGWMASLAPVREELLRGDLRPLYLAWLLGVQLGDVEESDAEPPVPPGLGHMSTPQKRLAAFLRLDPHLIAAAAKVSTNEVDTREQLAPWIAALPAQDKDRLLLDVAQGRGPSAQSWLLQRYLRTEREGQDGARARGAPRTVKALRDAADALAQAAEQRAARAQARRDAEAAAMRVRYLEELAARQDDVWRDAERLVEAKQSKAYEQAVRMLRDLHDMSVQRKETNAFAARLASLLQRHGRKSLFMARLRKAGLVD